MKPGIMIFTLLAFCLGLSSSSFAREADENLRAVLKARSNGQLSRFLTDKESTLRLRRICDAQLRSSRVPGACFDLIKKNPDKKSELIWLTRLCSSRVASSRDWRELAAIARSPSAPEKCRLSALRRQEDLQYVDQEERPAEVFARNH